MSINETNIQKLEAFKNKSKFDPDTEQNYYPGIEDAKLKPQLTELINKACEDFILSAKNNPTEESFQKDIKVGLSRFNPLYLNLDTEDRERVCYYFEELMDCVGLESSNGQLNDWMYGFDPNE